MMEMILQASYETLIMVFFSTLFSLLIGLPLGVVLVITRKDGIYESPILYRILDMSINFLRSVPFIILIFLIFPLSRILVGTTIGTKGAVVPLSVAAAPFVARIMESVLLEVDRGVIEASKAMGATPGQIIWHVLLPESMPAIINGMVMTIINIIGYSAMAGIVGGGGLGDIANRFGHIRGEKDVLWMTVFVIVIMVQFIQFVGDSISRKINKK